MLIWLSCLLNWDSKWWLINWPWGILRNCILRLISLLLSFIWSIFMDCRKAIRRIGCIIHLNLKSILNLNNLVKLKTLFLLSFLINFFKAYLIKHCICTIEHLQEVFSLLLIKIFSIFHSQKIINNFKYVSKIDLRYSKLFFSWKEFNCLNTFNRWNKTLKMTLVYNLFIILSSRKS
jgi:hypothetical protein